MALQFTCNAGDEGEREKSAAGCQARRQQGLGCNFQKFFLAARADGGGWWDTPGPAPWQEGTGPGRALRAIGGFGSHGRSLRSSVRRAAVALEGGVAVLRDDDVLKHRYAEESPALLQPLRHLPILRGRRRVPARVIMRHDNRGGIVH